MFGERGIGVLEDLRENMIPILPLENAVADLKLNRHPYGSASVIKLQFTMQVNLFFCEPYASKAHLPTFKLCSSKSKITIKHISLHSSIVS